VSPFPLAKLTSFINGGFTEGSFFGFKK